MASINTKRIFCLKTKIVAVHFIPVELLLILSFSRHPKSGVKISSQLKIGLSCLYFQPRAIRQNRTWATTTPSKNLQKVKKSLFIKIVKFPNRVARWFIFKPKITIWVNFGGLCVCKMFLNILWPFWISYGHCVEFVVIWYIFPIIWQPCFPSLKRTQVRVETYCANKV
jgi:hypothetical protein